MGLETERLSKLLKECIDDVGGFLPMEIRVASIDAHRRMPSCERTRDLYFLNYYRNFSLDTELRIASYLQVMRCPDYNVVKTIKHTLKLEEINQGIFFFLIFLFLIEIDVKKFTLHFTILESLCPQSVHSFGVI